MNLLYVALLLVVVEAVLRDRIRTRGEPDLDKRAGTNDIRAIQLLVIRAQDGEQSLSVDPADLEAAGIPHLASHAGLTDLGLKIYYEEVVGERFIKGSEESPPPF